MRTMTTILGTAATLLVLAGCGDGALEGDASALEGADGVEAVSVEYLRGIAAGDGPAACGLLDAASQQALIATHAAASSCLQAVEAASDSLSPDDRAALEDVEIRDVEVAGNTGTAHVELSEAARAATGLADGRITLDRVEAHWGISLAGAPAS
jgi:hypothetical protein